MKTMKDIVPRSQPHMCPSVSSPVPWNRTAHNIIALLNSIRYFDVFFPAVRPVESVSILLYSGSLGVFQS